VQLGVLCDFARDFEWDDWAEKIAENLIAGLERIGDRAAKPPNHPGANLGVSLGNGRGFLLPARLRPPRGNVGNRSRPIVSA